MQQRFETFTVLIAKISRSIRRIKAEEMSEFHLKGPHVSCLYYLTQLGPLTAGQLCDRCEEDKAAVSRSLEYLEQNGYVTRPDKRYRSPLTLTEKGQETGRAIAGKIDRLVEAGVMPVLISTDRQDIPLNSVCFDDFAGGVMAARHLVECGFRRIGFLCGSDKARSFLRRRSGVMVQTIDSLGFENFESRTPKTSDDSEVAVCFREWLESGHCPEAIITSHASAAAVVCRELKSCGLSCPEDYSIITFDDTIDNVFGLEITHLHIYPRELGIKSAQRIYQMMSSSGKDDRPYKIVLPLELTMGNSVKCRAK